MSYEMAQRADIFVAKRYKCFLAADESFALSGSATLADEKKFGGLGGLGVCGLRNSLARATV